MARRLSPAQIFRDCQVYLIQRTEHVSRERKFEVTKSAVRAYLRHYGEENADGNLVYKFPKIFHGVDGKDYAGVELRRQQGPAFLEHDDVAHFLKRKFTSKDVYDKIYDRVFRLTRVMDADEMYVLQQEGLITEEELRGLLRRPDPKYALWPVEAPEILEDE